MIIKILKKTRTVLTYFFVYYPIFFFSYLTPRNKQRWAFGNGKNMGDNTKYLYFEVIERLNDIEAVWICTDKEETKALQRKGINAYYYLSVRGIFLLLTSGVYITSYYLNDVGMLWTLGRAKYINLWHGIPLKNLAYKTAPQISGNKLFNSKFGWIYIPFKLHLYIKPDIFLSTSKEITQYFSECFRISKNRFVEADYPRCKGLLSDTNMPNFIKLFHEQGVKKLELARSNKNKVFIYMPTWRDSRSTNYLEDAHLDLPSLQKYLEDSNSLLLVKLHPRTPMQVVEDFIGYANIIVLENNLDIYPLLPLTDVLITDYSSIYFDYMHLKDKYTVFFSFDYDEYVTKDRDLVFDYDKNINGIRVNTFAELMHSLKTESYKAIDHEKAQALYEKFWGKPEDKLDLINVITQQVR